MAPGRSRIRFAAGVGLASLCMVHGLAQQQFTSRTDVVVVDFVATTNSGTAVIDLDTRDVQLTVDGKIRSLQSLELVRVEGRSVVTPATSVTPTTTTPVTSTTPAPARTARRSFHLVFDEDSMRPGDEREPQQSASRFLDTLSPADAVAVISLPMGQASTPLTTDRDVTRAALARLRGRLPPPPPPTRPDLIERACFDNQRSRTTFKQVRDLMGELRSADGIKVVILTSSGLNPPNDPLARGSGPACAAVAIEPVELVALGAAAADARVQFFTIQPHAFMIEAGGARGEPSFLGYSDYHAYLDGQLQGLEAVTGATGGDLFRLSGSGDRVFETIRRQTEAYYLLTFSVLPSDRDGKSHKIGVKTARKGVAIRARPSFRLSPG